MCLYFFVIQEVRCLQDNYEKLSADCQEAIRTFTEDEDENIELDAILIRACTPMIKKFCEVSIFMKLLCKCCLNCLSFSHFVLSGGFILQLI